MKKIYLLSMLLTIFNLHHVFGQENNQVIPLYTGKIPNEVPGPDEETTVPGNMLRIEKVRKPSITVYLPPKDKATGTAVIICPGGGYGMLAAGHEGIDVAKKLNENGIAAFVLKYRLPNPKVTANTEIGPLQDAQQALRLVRSRAKEWQINPGRIGIMGFSAGGHLASTAGTHFQKTHIPNPENTSLRPDFMLLIYPVISSDPKIAHQGSFNNLLGKNAAPEKMKAYSNELQVTPQTPPTFLIHASDDAAVPANNSVVFYQALLENKIPAELHIYQKGGHGFGLNNKTTQDLWFDRCLNWLASNGLTKPATN